MTEAPPRPGPAAVFALVILGVAVFVVPQLFRQPGFIDFVDAPLRPGGEVATASVFDLLAGRVGEVYAPLAHLSYRFDHGLAAIAGDLAGVMHLHSVLLHILAAVCLLGLLLRMGIARIRAVAGAALFLVHPAGLETTAVIAFRPAILAGLFSILALWFAVRHGQRGGVLTIVGVALATVAAVASSPLAVGLPILAAVVGIRRAGVVRPSITVMAVAGLAVAATGCALVGFPVTGYDSAATLDPVLALLWPRTGAMVLEPVVGTSEVAGILALGVLVALTMVAARLRRSRPGIAAALGLLVCAGLLAGLVVGATSRPMPNFASYLALLGGAGLLATMPWPRRVTIAVGATAVVAGAVVDFGHAEHYRDGRALWGRLADSNPIAATLYAEELAASPLDTQRKSALAHLERALAVLPEGLDRLRALELLVEVFAQLGRSTEASNTAEAMCALGETLTVDHDRLLALYLRTAQCFSVEDSRVKIDEYFRRAGSIAPHHPDVVAAGAEQQYVALVEAVRRERKDEKVDRKPGWLSVDEPRLAPILVVLEGCLAQDPACYRGLVLRGRITEATGGVLSALPFYQRAIAAAPERVGARILLAALYVSNEQHDAAERCILQAFSDGLDDAALHYVLGNIYALQGRRDDARRLLEAYVKNRPGNRNAEILLANLLSAEALGNIDRLEVGELKKLADGIAALNPDDPKGLMVRAAVLCKSRPRKYVEAIVLLENALLTMPGNADATRQLACAHRDYGWSLALSGKRDLAMDHFKTFLAIAPRGVRREAVHNALIAYCLSLEKKGQAQLHADQSAVAEASFRRSSELMPQRADSFYLLGLAFFYQAKPEDAIPRFEAAIRVGTAAGDDISHYWLPLIDCLQRVGRGAEAKRRGAAFLAAPGHADVVTLAKIRELLR